MKTLPCIVVRWEISVSRSAISRDCLLACLLVSLGINLVGLECSCITRAHRIHSYRTILLFTLNADKRSGCHPCACVFVVRAAARYTATVELIVPQAHSHLVGCQYVVRVDDLSWQIKRKLVYKRGGSIIAIVPTSCIGQWTALCLTSIFQEHSIIR